MFWGAESVGGVPQSLALPATLCDIENHVCVSLGEAAWYHLTPVSLCPDILGQATEKKMCALLLSQKWLLENFTET